MTLTSVSENLTSFLDSFLPTSKRKKNKWWEYLRGAKLIKYPKISFTFWIQNVKVLRGYYSSTNLFSFADLDNDVF